MDYQIFLFNLCELVVFNNNGTDDEFLAKLIIEIGEPSTSAINLLKDRGNVLFKDGNILLAGLHYTSALKFLCFLGLPPLPEQHMASTLAFSLILNLAFCELRLANYSKALLLCNFVLTFEPCNVKALYRRGLAFKRLNSLTEALDDFESASKLDPSNKDITRELTCVVDELAVNVNGKRVAFPFDPLASNKKGRKPNGNDVITSNGKRETPHCDHLDSERKDKKPLLSPSSADCIPDRSPSVPMDFVSCSHEISHDTEDSASSATSKSPLFTFTSKKRPHNKLNLSSQNYENLLHGKNLGFYHPRSMSFMRVRTLTTKTIQTGTPQDEISGSAEVPPSPPLSKESDALSVFSLGNDRVVQEDVVLQITKKMRVSPDSAQVSKASTVQFQFVTVGDNENRGCRRKADFSHHRSRVAQASFSSKKRSSVSVDFSLFLCRSIKEDAVVRTTKRKEANLFHFDELFHRPYKKSRLTFSVSHSCSVSSVSWLSSTQKDSAIPGFVL